MKSAPAKEVQVDLGSLYVVQSRYWHIALSAFKVHWG